MATHSPDRSLAQPLRDFRRQKHFSGEPSGPAAPLNAWYHVTLRNFAQGLRAEARFVPTSVTNITQTEEISTAYPPNGK
jgi:hypothetical protein